MSCIKKSHEGEVISFSFILLIILMAFPFSGSALAGDCRITGQTCVEGPETRNIAGNMIYKACWRYRSTYECIKPDSVDYCAAISKVAGCYQTSTSCISTAWNGTCLVEQRTYRCDNPATTKPSNTVQLDNTYTIVRDELDTSQCNPLATNPLCYIASHTCIEGPGNPA